MIGKRFNYGDGMYGFDEISVMYGIPENDSISWHFRYRLGSNCQMKVYELTLFWSDLSLYDDMLKFCRTRNMLKKPTNEYCYCDYIFEDGNISYVFKKNKAVVILIE